MENLTVRQDKFIPLNDGLRLFVETFGNPDQEACLFISGAGANSSFWSDRLCENLANKGFFAIKYDHRDIGFSSKIDWNKDPYEFFQLAKDALGILDALNIKDAHVVGHSMGGFIAQLLAIHIPDRIISMTSASSSTNSPSIPPPPDKTWEIYLSNSPLGVYEQDLEGFMEVWEYLNGTAKFDRDLAIQYTKNIYARQAVAGALGSTHVKAQESLQDRSEALKKVKMSCLIIHGEEDYAVDRAGGIQTAKSIEHSELVLIPQMGHMPFNHEILNRFETEIVRFIFNNQKDLTQTKTFK